MLYEKEQEHILHNLMIFDKTINFFCDQIAQLEEICQSAPELEEAIIIQEKLIWKRIELEVKKVLEYISKVKKHKNYPDYKAEFKKFLGQVEEMYKKKF